MYVTLNVHHVKCTSHKIHVTFDVRKRIRDVGWVVEKKKQTRRVCGAVSPDLTLRVHDRAFDLLVKTCMRSFR